MQADGRQPGAAHPKPTLSRRSRPAAGTLHPPPSGAPSQAPSSKQPPERLRSRPPSPANRVRVGRAMRAAAIPASLSGTSDGRRRWAGRRRELWRAAAAVPSWRERQRQSSCSRGSTSCPGEKTTCKTEFLLICIRINYVFMHLWFIQPCA